MHEPTHIGLRYRQGMRWLLVLGVLATGCGNDTGRDNTSKDAVNYVMFSAGSWSSVKTVALSDKLTADAAVAALSRMISQ